MPESGAGTGSSSRSISPVHQPSSQTDSQLLQLPEEILLRVLRAVGCKGLSAAACSCRQLLTVQTQLKTLPAFASAMEIHSNFKTAVTSACARAADAMPAAVEFALVFTCGYKSSRKSGTQSSCLDPYLRTILPPGVAIVGCSGEGLVGNGPDGRPCEVDPEYECRGVSVLLGYVPGLKAQVFAQDKAPLPSGGPEGVAEWMSMSVEDAKRALLMVVFMKGNMGHHFDPTDNGLLLSNLHKAMPSACITGGIHSNRGQLYSVPGIGHSGARAPQAAADGQSMASADKWDFVGMVLHRTDAEGDTSSSLMTGGPSSSVRIPSLSQHLTVASMAVRGMKPLPQSRPWHVEMQHNVTRAFLYGRDLPELFVEMEQYQQCSDNDLVWVSLWREQAPGGERSATVVTEIIDISQNHMVIDIHPHELKVLNPIFSPEQINPMANFVAVDTPLCCQLVTVDAQTSREILKSRLPELMGKAPLTPAPSEALGGLAGMFPPDTRWLLDERLAAQKNVATSSTVAGISVCCLARGSALYDSSNEESRMLADACAKVGVGSFPVAGLFCGGEIGPHASGGSWGMQRSWTQDGQARGTHPELQDSCLQEYTSVFTRLRLGER